MIRKSIQKPCITGKISKGKLKKIDKGSNNKSIDKQSSISDSCQPPSKSSWSSHNSNIQRSRKPTLNFLRKWRKCRCRKRCKNCRIDVFRSMKERLLSRNKKNHWRSQLKRHFRKWKSTQILCRPRSLRRKERMNTGRKKTQESYWALNIAKSLCLQ